MSEAIGLLRGWPERAQTLSDMLNYYNRFTSKMTITKVNDDIEVN